MNANRTDAHAEDQHRNHRRVLRTNASAPPGCVTALVSPNPVDLPRLSLHHPLVRHPAVGSAFATMLDCAESDDKLVNIHSAGAEQTVLEMLRTRNLENVILHWYSGPVETLRALLDCGHHFTVGVAVLYDEQIRAIARYIPDDRLLTETDNPGGERFHTGRTGRPDLIAEIETCVADLRATDTEALCSLVKRNALRLLKPAPTAPEAFRPSAAGPGVH